MNKKFDSGLALILPNNKINLFVIFIIILGIISGSIFMTILNETDKSTTISQISTFMSNINSNNINNFNSFKNAFMGNFILISLIWIFGMSIIGIAFNIFFIYLKSFSIGFSLSAFISLYKYKGLLASLIYIFPTSIINLFILLLLGSYSIIFTINLLKTIFIKDKLFNFKHFFKKYIIVFIISFILIVISSLCEGYLLPSIMKLVVKLFI